MKVLNLILFGACSFVVEAAVPPAITPPAKRAACLSLRDGPKDTGIDSSLTITNGPGAATAATATTGGTASAFPTCYHGADPHGDMGLCADLAKNGWCDCGSVVGTFSVLSGDNVCGYTTQPPSSATAKLTKCAKQVSTTLDPKVTQAPQNKCPTGSDVDCADCPNGYQGDCVPDELIGSGPSCSCKDPCGKIQCAVKLKF